MNDIIKDPIQPGANPTPTPTKSNNTGLIIAVVVLCLFFLLPMFFVFMVFRTFSNFIDDFDFEFNESDYGTYQPYRLSDEEGKSFQSIWLATQDETIAKRGIGYSDCMSIIGSSWGFYYSNQHVFDDFGWHDDAICNEVIHAKSEIKDEYYVLYISDGNSCSSYTTDADFNKILEFSKYSSTNHPCVDMISIPLVRDLTDDEHEVMPNNTTNGTGTTPTSRT